MSRGMTEMRSDWTTREFCNVVQARLQRGEMTARAAAEQLRAHLVPLHVALRIVAGD